MSEEQLKEPEEVEQMTGIKLLPARVFGDIACARAMYTLAQDHQYGGMVLKAGNKIGFPDLCRNHTTLFYSEGGKGEWKKIDTIELSEVEQFTVTC